LVRFHAWPEASGARVYDTGSGGDIDTKIGKVGAVFEQAFDDTIFIGIVCASVKDDLHGRPLLFNSPSASFLAQAYV